MSTDTPSPESNPSSAQVPYVVVARRYRPQTFDDLVGQDHVVRALTSAIDSQRVGHAYLFTGARGVGKTSAARILAKALNCQTGATTTPCNDCDICRSISGGDDVDVLEIDGASNRGIDEIRQLRQNVTLRPSRSRYKIYIIDEVHMLTKEAFNALLKTLEEPPEHVKFIFATTEATKIPITILSRCQRLDFAGIGTAAIRARLEQITQAENVSAETEALDLIARRAAGSMRDGQSLLDQLLAMGDEKIMRADVHSLLGTAPDERLTQLVKHLVDRNAAAALAELDEALQEGVDVEVLLGQLVGYFRDTMVAQVGCPPEQFLQTTAGQAEEVSRVADQLGVETILATMQILDQSLSRLRTSLHGRTLAELAIVQVCNLEDLQSLPALIRELRTGGEPTAGATPNTAAAGRPADTAAKATSKKNETAVENSLPNDNASAPRDHTRIDGASPVPPAPGPLHNTRLAPDSAESIWQQALSELTDRAELVADQAAFYCRVESPQPNSLLVSFPNKYNACKSYCDRPEQKAKLEKGLLNVVGETVRVKFCTVAEDAADGPAPSKEPQTTPRQMREKITQRPLVRRAIDLFGATRWKIDSNTDRSASRGKER